MINQAMSAHVSPTRHPFRIRYLSRTAITLLIALTGMLLYSEIAQALPTASCSTRPTKCLQSITAQNSPFSNTAAPTWLPRFRVPTSREYIYVDAGEYFMVQVNDLSLNTLLSVKSSFSLSKKCSRAVCRDRSSITTYRAIGRLQYEISASRKSGVTSRQLIRVARSLRPVSSY